MQEREDVGERAEERVEMSSRRDESVSQERERERERKS